MLLITVVEAKAQCRIEPEMTDEDALLTGLIEAAISHIQSDINKPLVAEGEEGQALTPALKLAALLKPQAYITSVTLRLGSSNNLAACFSRILRMKLCGV